MTTRFTHQDVHDIIQNQWESDDADKALAVLRQHDGKAITKRLCDKMPDGPWYLHREYGMTHIENEAYRRARYDSRTQDTYQNGKGLRILLCHSEASVPLDANRIEELNAQYFRGRRERNHARMEAMNTKATLDAMASAMSGAASALADLASARYTFEQLTGYGETLNPDKYDFERACGLREKA